MNERKLSTSSTTPRDLGHRPAVHRLQPESAEQMPSGFSARHAWPHSGQAGWQVHSRAKRPRIFAVSSSLQRPGLHCYLTKPVHTARLPMCSAIWNFPIAGQVKRILKNSRWKGGNSLSNCGFCLLVPGKGGLRKLHDFVCGEEGPAFSPM